MNPADEKALDDCLDRLLSGESVESCLDGITEQEMIYLVELAAFARLLAGTPVPLPSAAAVDAGRERMLARLRERSHPAEVNPAPARSNGHRRGFSWRDLNPKKFPLFQAATAFLLIVLLSSGFAVNASANSLPGEALYPVKIAWEGLRLTLTDGSGARQQLKSQFQVERQQEIQQVAQAHHSAETTYQDILKRKGPSRWRVGELWIEIRPETQLIGNARVGDEVSITVQVQPDGSMVAETVRVIAPAAGIRTQAQAAPGSRIALSQTVQAKRGIRSPAHTQPAAPRSNPNPQKTSPPAGSFLSPTAPTEPPSVVPSTSTPTSTQTPTQPATASATSAPVSSATETVQPSETGTALPTPTPTAGASATPGDTGTPTSLPSQTNTPTPTATDTPTPTYTPLPTATDTPSPAPTAVSPSATTDLPVPTGPQASDPTPALPAPTPTPAPSSPAFPLINILIKILQFVTPTISP